MDQTKVNADIRKLYGDTVSRQQLLDYQKKTGVNVRWIRRDASLRVGKGLYRVPGGGAKTVVAAAPPVKLKSTERAVLPTPFDDGAYDPPAPVEKTPSKRGRKSAQDAVLTVDSGPERPLPKFITAYFCSKCGPQGMRPVNAAFNEKGDYIGAPVCEDHGVVMKRHSWTPRQKGQYGIRR